MSEKKADRGKWNSKLGFVLAAAGSAVGLGNIWGFPTQVADNGGATFILIYVICCLCVGLPVMIAEFAIGRHTRRNPVGAFKKLGSGWFPPLIGLWGVMCGVMILSFYLVIAGWTVSFIFEEIFYYLGWHGASAWVSDLGNGPKNAFFSILFMAATIGIITGGVSNGIERATKTMMPVLIFVLIIMIVYVFTLEGSMDGLRMYLLPDLSGLNTDVFFSALGQAFFSLSLGMGALLTYGSYLRKNQNIVESATYVTIADMSIAFLAGLLIIPAMFVAQNAGITIIGEDGRLFSSATLVFDVLPGLFKSMGGAFGLIFGTSFFLLLSMAALTSTISLLEVPVSYVIDEHKIARKKAALLVGGLVLLVSLLISFMPSMIDVFATIFNNIGLPLGGLMLCLFLAWFWKAEHAITEIEQGYEGIHQSMVKPVWILFVKYICPLLIALVLVTTLYNLIF
ncbi:sodium-dependent transporter [Balneolaceae bacterium ANBcel3]|nr:sodium-dependent transporter [Balneolaceae bacterium ANBcel3]